MIYRNPTLNTLTFDIDGERFVVPPGGECHIGPKHAHVVTGRGLPLVEGTKGGALAEPTMAPEKKARFMAGVAAGVDEPEEKTPPGEDESPAVSAAVDKLKAQGAMPTKGKRR